ncbi:hypothetical protein SAMN00017405_0535 [Desulfonispora thiosulfatigenes DSM 11270]|uniref:Novel STAND NTPase 5 domain-containing protein n=1 Tax=Desulfonispora thiosulfatigenes DSM 11270 TaxID=656914 RepID=A0A1W1V677_DESTI|nr:hypothetical protein [Desulfonispora thiosulfatigenes]SMB88823.1 hypothetical protein SAMN00017405_0535 [Desulfonispora thiosulfatigenes DSM 11270]
MTPKKSSKKKKKVVKPVYRSLSDLERSRTGGQVALSGFTYQFLYSCYLMLSEKDESVSFTLEGLEDIDRYKCDVTSNTITHIQLKYSTQRQDASFLKDVLKNYLEVYLLDNTHDFKLVYDFDIAKGNLNKLVNNNLDEASKKYWVGIIEKIMEENTQWNWSGFSSNAFLGKITFEKRVKDDLTLEIEKLLIERHDITTDNIRLYVNGIKVCCLEKMEYRESINRKELDAIIQNINDDISKGIENPAHGWIKKVDFSVLEATDEKSYFEGKKASPQDIALKLPVRRIDTEKEVEDSINSNRVTVIKASSGQGKTTIALQVALNLSNEYNIYQLTWCNDAKELNNIIKYFKSRVKLGEKPLIIIDNLDSQLSEWNRLAQLLQEEITYNYKLLLTSREDDWYRYSGNLSNVKSLRTVEISLNNQEAEDIFFQLKKRNLLHDTVSDWRGSWKRIEEKRLLIEYVYLLTHGEMISERISQQISTISTSENGRIKCEILRIVCFADVCGIRLPVMKIIHNLKEPTSSDYGEILKSVENEFLISIDENEKFVEGLHPVRSMHIVKRLHEFYSINNTAINVIKLTDLTYLSKLFSNLPKWITNREEIYDDIVKLCGLERERLNLLIMTCEYYIEHKPSKYFNKYSIRSWYSKKKEQLIIDSSTALNQLQENYDVSFPVDYYSVGILKHYPIIANNLNVEDPDELTKFLYLCSSITSIDYDYLVIAVKSGINQVMPNGLKVPYNFLKDLRVAIDDGNWEVMEKLSPPFPYEISTGFLNCFEEKMNLLELATSPYEGIDSVFELLWSYSISRDILVDKIDSEYLSGILMEYEKKITNLLKVFEGKIPAKEYAVIKQVCYDVYNGGFFGDAELNNYNNSLISLASNLQEKGSFIKIT